MLEQGVLWAIALLVLGVTFNAGRLTVRVEHLERFRGEVHKDLRAMRESMTRLEQLALRWKA